MYALIGMSMVLTACLIVAVLTSAVLTIFFPLLRRFGQRLAPRAESRFWLLVGLAPVAAGTLAGFALVGPGFLLFEPQHTNERIPLRMALLAALSFLLFSASVARSAWVLYKTARVSRSLRQCGRPLKIDELQFDAYEVPTGSGISVVMGISRPTLFFSRAVLDSLSESEFHAVVKHEQEHVQARDNVVSLLLECGFLLSANPVFAGLVRPRWLESTEIAADTAAAKSSADAFELLSALVKVARLRDSRSVVAGLGCSFVPFSREPKLLRRVTQLRAIADGAQPVSSTRSRTLLIVVSVTFLMALPAVLPSAMGWAHSALELLMK